jgi:hypothetical protein
VTANKRLRPARANADEAKDVSRGDADQAARRALKVRIVRVRELVERFCAPKRLVVRPYELGFVPKRVLRPFVLPDVRFA